MVFADEETDSSAADLASASQLFASAAAVSVPTGSKAAEVAGVKCPRCETVNAIDARKCQACWYPFGANVASTPVGETERILESVKPQTPVPTPESPSPAALIGFGAVLSLAAASYPWYMLGGDEAQPATLSQLLDVGWKGFPGAPLTMIAIAAVTSAIVSLIRSLDTIRAPVSVISGLVTLLSATWLWEGLSRIQSDTADSTLPITGAVLAAIGAIVMIAVGFYLGTSQRARPPGELLRLRGATAQRASPNEH